MTALPVSVYSLPDNFRSFGTEVFGALKGGEAMIPLGAPGGCEQAEPVRVGAVTS